MPGPNPTVDPSLRSWVPVPEGSDFPIQNLPYGVFRRGDGSPRCGVAIGEHVLDLAEASQAGLLAGLDVPPGIFERSSLNEFLAAGRQPVWRATRGRLSELLSEGDREIRDRPGLADRVLVPAGGVDLLLPIRPGDYVDFYSSIEHASNMGRMFRPDTDPLLPNWRSLPVGYHGRASSVVDSGTPVLRPLGISKPDGVNEPVFGPTQQLDIELEVGFATGPGNALGRPIPIAAAGEQIFGLVLVNDWSARDIQRYEYQPLGPFLGKSFATSISPWVVTLDALEPYRMAGPPQVPPPLAHLATEEPWAFDIELEVLLSTRSMDERDLGPDVISRTNFRGMYWSMAQQLAHAASNGTNIRPGDLYASGTISGSTPDSYGSLIELTWRGTKPLTCSDGSRRKFLEDGDTVIMRGWCGDGTTRPRIGFGEVRGTILPAAPGGSGG
jgi:fumarylacetoacetase